MYKIPENLPHNCCYICGHEFEVVEEKNKCTQCGEICDRESLITEWDDYAWCY